MNFLLVFTGGGMGSLLRYLIGLLMARTGWTLPWATFAANASACIIFALVLMFTKTIEAGSSIRLLMLTGFCGGLSTFSAFGYETFLLLDVGQWLYAVLNIIFSVSVCVSIFYFFK